MTGLKDTSGFKDELIAGGQGGAVSRHIYGHAGSILAYGPAGSVASYGQQAGDYGQQFLPNRTEGEANAEIADDIAARKIADAILNALVGLNFDRWMNKTTCDPACDSKNAVYQGLSKAISDILCK